MVWLWSVYGLDMAWVCTNLIDTKLRSNLCRSAIKDRLINEEPNRKSNHAAHNLRRFDLSPFPSGRAGDGLLGDAHNDLLHQLQVFFTGSFGGDNTLVEYAEIEGNGEFEKSSFTVFEAGDGEEFFAVLVDFDHDFVVALGETFFFGDADGDEGGVAFGDHGFCALGVRLYIRRKHLKWVE